MPRYLVERTFPDRLVILTNSEGAQAMRKVVDTNTQRGVTWVTSYVNPGKTKTYCVYDAPDPEAIRAVADRNSLPVDQITEVSVLDPYFYVGEGLR
jgi:hypothetical protein